MKAKHSKAKTLGFNLVGLLLGVVLVCLGLWQLERAEYKRLLQDRFFENQAMLPLRETELARPGVEKQAVEITSELAFRQLRLSGRFDPDRSFLLDNQVFKGRLGYRVISLFVSDTQRSYLLDRGWLPAEKNRGIPDVIETPHGPVMVLSVIWPNLGHLPVLKADPLKPGWPRRIQSADIAQMQKALKKTVFPSILHIERAQPGSLQALNRQISFKPERHTAYAVQWFGLAGVMLIGLCVLHRRGKEYSAV